MPRYVFDEVTVRRAETGKCSRCGKRVRRTARFTNTVSPFNKTPLGTVKTPAEVRADVQQLAAAWVPDFTHTGDCTSTETNDDKH